MIERLRKPAKCLGYGLQLLAFLSLLAWVQSADADCLLSSDVFLQLRLCGPEYVAQPTDRPFLLLLASIALLVVGRCIVRWGRGKPPATDTHAR